MPIKTDSLNKDLYNLLKVRGFDPIPKDTAGQTTPVPDDADVFKFTYANKGRKYGNAWVTVDGKDLIVYFDDSINTPTNEEEGADEIDNSWTGFLQTLKTWAQRRQLGFDVKNQDHLQMDMAQRDHMKKEENIHESAEKKPPFSNAKPKQQVHKDEFGNIIKPENIASHLAKKGRAQAEKGEKKPEGMAEGAPELLKAEMPLVRHIEKELAQHGYEKGTPEYDQMFKHAIAMYRKFGNIDAIKQGVAEGSEEKDPVWNKGTPMPKDYTCHCGLYVHPSRRNPKAIHASDCPYAKKQDKEQGVAEGSLNESDTFTSWYDWRDQVKSSGYTIAKKDGKIVALNKQGQVVGHWSDVGKFLSGKAPRPNFKRPAQQGMAEGAPELLKAEMPLVRHIEKELIQHGYEKGTPEYDQMFKQAMSMYRKFGNIDAIKKDVAEAAKWRQGYRASGHPAGFKHKSGEVGPLGGTFDTELQYGDEKKVPVQRYRDENDPLAGREKAGVSQAGKPLLPKNKAKNLKFLMKQAQGKHGPVQSAVLPEQVNEGYYALGNKKSYNDAIPNVKIILQHSRQIEEGEQRYRNVERIFLENMNGERFLAPTNRPGIAQIYARHLAEGGVPNDERWNHLKSLCEEYSKMAGFVRATRSHTFNESAQKLVNEGIQHYISLRESLGKLRGHRGYNAYFESWSPPLMEEEDSEDRLNELFVQETLDPRIESVMPILSKLHKKISESDIKEVTELEEWASSLIENNDNVSGNPQGIPENAMTESYMSNVDAILRGIVSGDEDLETILNHPSTPDEAFASRELQRMYDDIAVTHNLHPDDDFEKIHEIMFRELEQRYLRYLDDLSEDLGPEQKAVGQLGPTEKITKSNPTRGKLVGASESVEECDEMLDEDDLDEDWKKKAMAGALGVAATLGGVGLATKHVGDAVAQEKAKFAQRLADKEDQALYARSQEMLDRAMANRNKDPKAAAKAGAIHGRIRDELSKKYDIKEGKVALNRLLNLSGIKK